MTTAAPVLGDAWAPTGAAGCSDWQRNDRVALLQLAPGRSYAEMTGPGTPRPLFCTVALTVTGLIRQKETAPASTGALGSSRPSSVHPDFRLTHH
jgi:hypothetical protein